MTGGNPSQLLTTTEAQAMIELKTNPDFLHTLAADTREAGREETAKDLDSAAHDIKNLRDYAERLEWNVHQMSSEINSIRTQRDEAAAALLAIFRPELEKMIDDALEYCRPFENLRERVEQLEEVEQIEGDDIRREVRNMIQDGEIIVNIDVV
jgi:uncharacterized coiled-coil DUF342 family protein